MLGAMNVDFIEIDSADFRGIDTIRGVRKQVRLRPSHPKSTCRVWLIDECHQLSKDAQNALLKGLEEAPEHVFFILCTTDPQKLLSTVKGRCTSFSVAPLSEEETDSLLRKVCRAERIRTSSTVRRLIHDQSFGRPRNSLKLLEKVASLPIEEMSEAIKIEAGKISEGIELYRALINQANWKKVQTILAGLDKGNEEGLRRMIIACCRSTVMRESKFNEKALIIYDEFEQPFFNNGWDGFALACYKATFAEINIPF